MLPHFEPGERIRGIVWQPLIQPKLSVEFALIWRRKNAFALIKEFAGLAGKKPNCRSRTKDIGFEGMGRPCVRKFIA